MEPNGINLQFKAIKKRGPDKKVQQGELCAVCFEQATGFNYGALTCNPCKSFFRRTILENNLTQKCDRGRNCRDKQIRRCIYCRLQQCQAVGMKGDYIRQLRIKSIRRRIEKIPKGYEMMKFSETLDPFQENFLSILEGFWMIYRDRPSNPGEQMQQSRISSLPVQRTAYDAVCEFEQKINKFRTPDPNFKSALDGITFVKDMVNLHVNMMLVFLEAIPSIRWHQLQTQTKQEVITYGAMEIPLIRSGGRALIGIPPARTQFERLGLSKRICEQMFSIVGDYIAIRPDSYETALVAALAATSPDRGISSTIDYKILSNIQETILEILRIKLHIDQKPMKVLASFVGFLQKLRIYSHESEEEWFRFITHKKKLMMMNDQSDRVDRPGVDFVVNGRSL